MTVSETSGEEKPEGRDLSCPTRLEMRIARASGEICFASAKGLRPLAGLAEGVDPSGQHVVVGRLEVEEFEAHADAGLDDADRNQAFDDLPLAD
jgi:hypothetical protein